MIIDKQTLLSEAQAITATAASTNYYDTGAVADVGVGEPMLISVTIPEAFNTLTSLAIALQCDDNTSFSSAKTLWTVSILLASLTLNAKIKVPGVPPGAERYLRMNYTVTGTDPTTGKITAGIVLDNQLNTSTPGGTAY